MSWTFETACSTSHKPLEKRHVRLMQLSDDELLSEVGSRTLPATDIEKLLATAERPRQKRDKN